MIDAATTAHLITATGFALRMSARFLRAIIPLLTKMECPFYGYLLGYNP